MPLTDYQAELAKLLAANRTPDSYLAGGAALQLEPNSVRFSNDLDFFHDSVERVTQAFEQDRKLLIEKGHEVREDMMHPGYIRAMISHVDSATKVEWSHDSAWRFLPTIKNVYCGYQLHPIDLALNKVLALVGRNEARDFLDTIYVHKTILPLGAMCWAAVGKDPGFTPHSLLSLLRRRGQLRPEDLKRLKLAVSIELTELKAVWLAALEQAELFINTRPPKEVGCLYYAQIPNRFVQPDDEDTNVVSHFGRPGGVLPNFIADPADPHPG